MQNVRTHNKDTRHGGQLVLRPNMVLVSPRAVEHPGIGFEHWSDYDLAFDEYLAIGGADCIVIENETPDMQGFISPQMARAILCALYKQKVIVALHPLGFSDEVDESTRLLISNRAPKIYIRNLTGFLPEQTEQFLAEVSGKIIDYRLSNAEQRFIEDTVQRHLFSLRAELSRNLR